MSQQLDELSSDDFEEKINSEGLVLIEFGADWCEPCKEFEPRVAEAVKNMESVQAFSVDVDGNQNLAENWSVRSIPKLLLFQGGEKLGEVVGSVPQKQVEEFLDEHQS